MKFSILPYAPASQSAKLLRSVLAQKGHRAVSLSPNSPRVERMLSQDASLEGHNVILWGGGALNGWLPSPALKERNKFFGVGFGNVFTNKRSFFETFSNPALRVSIYIPRVLKRRTEALAFLQERRGVSSSNYPLLVERQSLTGTNGDGIIFLHADDEPTGNGQLWVEYQKKTTEYRVHVVGDRIIHTQVKHVQKSLLEGLTEGQKEELFRLRNYDNGWRFSSVDVADIPSTVVNAAESFIASSEGLSVPNVYALDVVYNSKSRSAYILEGNRAPGLSDVTVQKYADAFIAQGVV